MADRRTEFVSRRAMVTVGGSSLLAPLVAAPVSAQARPDRLAAEAATSNLRIRQPGIGAESISLTDKLNSLPISTAEWGIVADSNGATGNGTDWTVQLQQLVAYARANGRDIFIPAKPGYFIRFTAPIDFTGAQTKMAVIGESQFDSALFADFTSASKVAAFSNDALPGARSYVAWRSFRLQGRLDTDAMNMVCGIYSNWGGEFSRFEDVLVNGFYDGFVIANDYYVRFDRCLAWYARNNGYQLGFTLSGAVGACNNLAFNACHATHCQQNGLYVYACRAMTINGGAYEANAGANVFLEYVLGGSISGIYNEYGPSESGNPDAQLRFRNCCGCTVNGYSASAFDNAGKAVIYVDEGCHGIILNGVAIETAGPDTSAIGIRVRGSFGVEINGGFFDGMTTGIRAEEYSRVTIATCNIMATTPVATDATGNVIAWRDAIDGQVAASVASISAVSLVDIIRTTLAKNVIDGTKVFQGVGICSGLASAATSIILNAELLSERYRITDIIVEVVEAFGGGGGDRALSIRDNKTVYTTIPAASLQTQDARGELPSTVVPYGTTGSRVTATQPGADLYMQYSDGTTDYTTSGVIVVWVQATRVGPS